MRQRKLNKHYNILKLELRLTEEYDWLEALAREIQYRMLSVGAEVGEVMKERLALERELCPVEICKPKLEPRKRGQKAVAKTEEELLEELKGFTLEQIKQIEEMLKSKKNKGGTNND